MFNAPSNVASPPTKKLLVTVTIPGEPPGSNPSKIRGPVQALIVLSAASVPPATPSVAIPIPAINAPDHS